LLQQAEAYGKLAAKRALELGLPAPSHLNKPKVLDAQSGLLAEEEKQNRRAGGRHACHCNHQKPVLALHHGALFPDDAVDLVGAPRLWLITALERLGYDVSRRGEEAAPV
jgi:hypothetical protein